jgi:hypothetical protein
VQRKLNFEPTVRLPMIFCSSKRPSSAGNQHQRFREIRLCACPTRDWAHVEGRPTAVLRDSAGPPLVDEITVIGSFKQAGESLQKGLFPAVISWRFLPGLVDSEPFSQSAPGLWQGCPERQGQRAHRNRLCRIPMQSVLLGRVSTGRPRHP